MLTVENALRAYAAMMNTLEVSRLEPLLADDFHYSSQAVFEEIRSKSEYIEYVTAKLAAIRTAGSRIWAEMGHVESGFAFPGPCVVLAQNARENVIATVVVEVKDGKITRLDMRHVAPLPHQAMRIGEYPE